MTHVTDTTFEEILASNKICVIDFSATWCGPCKKIAPIINELAEQYKEKVFIGKIDVDENPEITEQFGIRNVPTILFFKDGVLLEDDKIVGAIDKVSLEKKIDALI
jgi:thioredoxin 1